MKLVSARQRERMIVLSSRRFRRTQASKARAAAARGAKVNPKLLRRLHRRESRYVRVEAPQYFGLYGEARRGPVLAFVRRLRELVVLGARVRIDFRHTRQMFPSGTILFRAELDRVATVFGSRRVRAFEYPRDSIVEQVLQHVGIARILGLPHRVPAHRLADNVKHWRSATGVRTEGESVEPLLTHYVGRITPSLSKSLYAGVVEAMANSLAHAYEEPRGDGIDAADMGRRWWMFSHEANGVLFVAFCDLGMGIPRSLTSSKKWSASIIEKLVSSLGMKPPKAARIKAAIEVGKTRTGQRHRGKGLDDVLHVVRNATRGSLTIYSDKGYYRFDGATHTEIMLDHDDDILGTVLEWNIPIASTQ